MDLDTSKLRLDTPAIYRIRLQGALDESWSERMSGLKIQVSSQADKAPVTTLEGWLIDQAALSGILMFVYDLGYPLLSVECLG